MSGLIVVLSVSTLKLQTAHCCFVQRIRRTFRPNSSAQGQFQFVIVALSTFSELDYERFTKRRKLYKESSVSPVQVGDELEVDESLKSDESASPQARQMHTSSLYDPDQLNREHDYQYKCRFFYSIGLQRVTPERRRGKSTLWLQVSCCECKVNKT